MTRVVAIVVTYNSEAYIRECLNSCSSQDISTIVVDNASTDATVAAIPAEINAHVIVNPENRGFAAAVNQAVRLVPADYYLLLNPDAQLLTPIEPLLEAIGAKGHSGAAGLLVGFDGIPQKGFNFRRLPTPAALAFEVLGLNRIWPGNPVNRRYRCWDLDPLQSQTVEQPAGAFLLFRRVDWLRLNGFDEGFHPIWFEDVDFCARLLNQGGTIWFDPSVQAAHHGGHSIQKIGVRCRQRFWYGSLLRYAALHFRPSSRRLVAFLVALAIVPRALFGVRGSHGNSAGEIIKDLWRLAWQCFRAAGSR